MKRISTAWRNLQLRSSGKQLLVVLTMVMVLPPVGARAAGLGDILSLIQTIASTLQNAVGGVLSEIQTVNSEINNFRQQIIWPINELNQVRGFVSAIRTRYGGLMSQIQGIKNNSARLANPVRLESALRGGQAGTMFPDPAKNNTLPV